jgi:hypothetical protein
MSKINELQLASGRRINLISINQWETYRGFLEGIPTKEINKDLIEEALDMVKPAPYLIEPIETPIIMERKYWAGTPASIPLKVCIAEFASFPRGGNPSHYDYSRLTLVWFQNEFAFPIEESILEEIRSLDWDKHASDFEF